MQQPGLALASLLGLQMSAPCAHAAECVSTSLLTRTPKGTQVHPDRLTVTDLSSPALLPNAVIF